MTKRELVETILDRQGKNIGGRSSTGRLTPYELRYHPLMDLNKEELTRILNKEYGLTFRNNAERYALALSVLDYFHIRATLSSATLEYLRFGTQCAPRIVIEACWSALLDNQLVDDGYMHHDLTCSSIHFYLNIPRGTKLELDNKCRQTAIEKVRRYFGYDYTLVKVYGVVRFGEEEVWDFANLLKSPTNNLGTLSLDNTTQRRK